MKQRFKRRLALLLAGGMLLALLSGCGDRGSDGAPLPDESAPTEIVTDSGETLTVTEPTPADSYGTLYQALTGVQQAVNDIYEISEMASIPEEQLVNPEAEEFGDPDYAKANIPAESLTEGDLIVTDGSYIYMICASELVIVAASGESTAEVGRIFVTNPPPEGYSGSETPQKLFVSGDNLYVVTYEYLYQSGESDGSTASSEKVHVKQYDISNKAEPVIVSDFAQSGRYLDSYVSGDVLYLIGAYSIWVPDEADASTYVPTITRNGEDALLEPSSIYICPGLDSTDYTVLSTIQLSDGAHLTTKALTGYNAWNAADGENLYLARTSYTYTMGDPYDQDQYSVTDYTYNAFTRLTRLSMDGNLELLGSGTVEGYLFGQGAMSLSDGNLYLGTIRNGYAYQVFTDEKYGFVNYQVGERTASNAVYALDGELNLLRSAEDVAGDETVYSIRFVGSTAYVMTYLDLIPKFAIDMTAETLSPTAISGLTDMAHNLYDFGENQTAGVGVSRDETGAVSSLRLDVYTASGTSLTLSDSVEVSDQWDISMNSPAAVQVFPEEQLIAVPVGSAYQIYAFENGALTEAGTVEMGYISASTRAFHNGDYWYFCNDATVVAVSAADMTTVAQANFAYG